MGNQLIKDTHVDKDPIGNGGLCAQWQMRSGHRLDKAKTPVTIFWYDKRNLAKTSSKIKEGFLTTLKKEAQMLARFKHPNIVGVVTPLIDDPKSLGFVTERVENSLYSLIAENKLSDIFPTELETKFHILEIAETLNFLHNSVRTCHLSISPENIYLTPDGKWKLGGLTFSTQIIQGALAETNINFNQQTELVSAPSIKFSAPEVVEAPSKGGYASDIFSLGCLIYTLYKIHTENSTNNCYLISAETPYEHKNIVSKIDRMDFSCLPPAIKPMVIRMLNHEPNMRITVNDILNHSWFQDPLIQTVKILETLYQREFPQQQVFLKGLAQNILKFEHRYIKSKIVPLLLNLFANLQLVPCILPIFFKFMEAKNPSFINRDEFMTLIWPAIKNLTTGREMPAQALYLLIQNMKLFIDFVDIKDLQAIFIPLLIKSFDCGVEKLQVLAIKKAESLFNKIDYNTLKSQMLPRILNLCTDNNVQVRKHALYLLSKTYTLFDRNVINDQVLAVLEKLRKMKNNYRINMMMLCIFEGIAKNIGMDTIANKILISLVPMLADQSLSKPEYKAYLKTVKAYLARIEDEQDTFYQGQPDTVPYEADDDLEDKPVKEEQPSSLGGGGGFDFLNTFEEVKSATKKPSSMNDFDFSGFDNMNSKPSNSQTPKNTFQSSSSTQNTASSQQNSLKKLGNPFNNPPTQKKEDMFQGMNLGGSNPTNFNQPSAQDDGWGNLDNELENLGFSSSKPSNTFQPSGGMSQNNNFMSNQNNNGGWQDFNIPQNNARNYSGGSQFDMNQPQNNFGYNQGNQYNQGVNFNKNKENQGSFVNPTMPKQQKPAKHQFGVADDFFESFDVPKSSQPKGNNNLNFMKKPNTLNTNDDLI